MTLIDTVIVVILYVSVCVLTKIQLLNLNEVKKSIKYGGQLCKTRIQRKKTQVSRLAETQEITSFYLIDSTKKIAGK